MWLVCKAKEMAQVTDSMPVSAVTQVWYHGGCTDGFGAAFAAWMVLGDKAKYVPVFYDRPMPEVADGDTVFMLDFSYPREVLLDLANRATVEVHDHHRTAKDALASLFFARFDMEHSGAVLAWKRFHGDAPVPPLLTYVEDRDLWRWRLPFSREVSAAIASYPHDFEQWKQWLTTPMLELAREGTSILRTRALQVDGIIDAANGPRTVALGGRSGRAICTPLLQSEVCERILQRFPEAEFAMAWHEDGKGGRKFSLRSRVGDDVDVSQMATRFSGGGHPAASGFYLPAGAAFPGDQDGSAVADLERGILAYLSGEAEPSSDSEIQRRLDGPMASFCTVITVQKHVRDLTRRGLVSRVKVGDHCYSAITDAGRRALAGIR